MTLRSFLMMSSHGEKATLSIRAFFQVRDKVQTSRSFIPAVWENIWQSEWLPVREPEGHMVHRVAALQVKRKTLRSWGSWDRRLRALLPSHWGEEINLLTGLEGPDDSIGLGCSLIPKWVFSKSWVWASWIYVPWGIVACFLYTKEWPRGAKDLRFFQEFCHQERLLALAVFLLLWPSAAMLRLPWVN
jgi:hypothetical protein